MRVNEGLLSEDFEVRSYNQGADQEVLTKKFFGQVDCMRTCRRYQFVFIELVLDSIQWIPSSELPRESYGAIQSSFFFDANLNMKRVIKGIVDRLDAIRSNWCFGITNAREVQLRDTGDLETFKLESFNVESLF